MPLASSLLATVHQFAVGLGHRQAVVGQHLLVYVHGVGSGDGHRNLTEDPAGLGRQGRFHVVLGFAALFQERAEVFDLTLVIEHGRTAARPEVHHIGEIVGGREGRDLLVERLVEEVFALDLDIGVVLGEGRPQFGILARDAGVGGIPVIQNLQGDDLVRRDTREPNQEQADRQDDDQEKERFPDGHVITSLVLLDTKTPLAHYPVTDGSPTMPRQDGIVARMSLPRSRVACPAPPDHLQSALTFACETPVNPVHAFTSLFGRRKPGSPVRWTGERRVRNQA